MRRFKKHNVERIVATDAAADKLIREGFKEVTGDSEHEEEHNLEYDEMKVEDLRTLAKERDIEGYSKLKKEELIAALEASEVPKEVV